MQYCYKTKGTCSKEIHFELDNAGTIHNVSFVSGCNGNLKGVSALAEGMNAEEIVKRFKGIRCGEKKTSCPDQFAKAIEEAIEAASK